MENSHSPDMPWTVEQMNNEVNSQVTIAPENIREEYSYYVLWVMATEADAHAKPSDDANDKLQQAKAQKSDFEAAHGIDTTPLHEKRQETW